MDSLFWKLSSRYLPYLNKRELAPILHIGLARNDEISPLIGRGEDSDVG